MKYVWMYRESKMVKHAFESPLEYVALCSAGRTSYKFFTWQYDEDGLKKRRKCINCIRVTEGLPW